MDIILRQNEGDMEYLYIIGIELNKKCASERLLVFSHGFVLHIY